MPFKVLIPQHKKWACGSGFLFYFICFFFFFSSVHVVKTNSVMLACFCRSGPRTSEDVPADAHLEKAPPPSPTPPVPASSTRSASGLQTLHGSDVTCVERWDSQPRRHPGEQSEHWDLYFMCESVWACARLLCPCLFSRLSSLQTCKMWVWGGKVRLFECRTEKIPFIFPV